MAGMEQTAAVPEQPIAENGPVQELLALLKENNPAGYQEFSKLIESVSLMESRLAVAVGELISGNTSFVSGLGEERGTGGFGSTGDEIKFSQNTKKRRHTHFVMYRFCNQNCFKMS